MFDEINLWAWLDDISTKLFDACEWHWGEVIYTYSHVCSALFIGYHDWIWQTLPAALLDNEVLALLLFMVSLLVLVVAAQLGWKHVNSGWLFASASLKLPLHLIGLKAVKIKLAWMYMSLFIGVWLMIAVNLEMILRQVFVLGRQEHHLRPIPTLDTQRAD